MYVITKINKNKILNFNDIKFIVKYTKKYINNKKILNGILNILNKDIKLRKEKFGIDCIKELKKEKLLLPSKIQDLLENK
jgi:ribosomal protein S24E